VGCSWGTRDSYQKSKMTKKTDTNPFKERKKEARTRTSASTPEKKYENTDKTPVYVQERKGRETGTSLS